MRLNLSTVSGAGGAAVPSYDPGAVTTGIVHIGLGGFHRGHQAVYVDDILGGDPQWGICAVAPRNPATPHALRAQDCLYTLWTRAGAEDALRVVGSIRETLCAAEDPDAVVCRIADPGVRLVTLTVTEKAYRADPVTRRLRLDDDIRAEVSGAAPRTVVGLLVRGLQARRQHGTPLTVLSCDNLSGNGDLLGNLVQDYAALLPRPESTRLLEWISQHVTFPSTMVDRIVPAITAAERAQIRDRLGLDDQAAVVAEPFGQWVVEDDFAHDRPQWTSPDVRLVDSSEPYERLKLRVVNASHSTLAYLGLLSGYDDVPAAAADEALASAVSRLVDDDVLPTLADVPADAVAAYRDTVLERFANPAIRYPLRQVAADGSQKLPQRLVPIARERLRGGQRPAWAALGIAAWMLWVHRCATGHSGPLQDPGAEDLQRRASCATSPASLVDVLLAVEEVLGTELPQYPAFRGDLEYWVRELWHTDAATVVKNACR